MKCLLFDNYDSFTYNLRHMLLELGLEVDVRRNDRIALDEVAAYDRIVLSPGPGIPSEAGLLLPLIRRYAARHVVNGFTFCTCRFCHNSHFRRDIFFNIQLSESYWQTYRMAKGSYGFDFLNRCVF